MSVRLDTAHRQRHRRPGYEIPATPRGRLHQSPQLDGVLKGPVPVFWNLTKGE
ncbi:hypothetical protein HIO72_13930 [Halomonas sp. PA5]|uniref:hypothetical protein n=1 Tax=unclassified Halomonas TaxID=2609666 RepID=UPI001599C805|nr:MULTISPECIES: hypothetical protein [unclassified Halomonas]QJQ96256.1 hypothetical protein HIO72_13930 [Halomonas sp. PA5]